MNLQTPVTDEERWARRTRVVVPAEDFEDPRARACYRGYRAWRARAYDTALEELGRVIAADAPPDRWLARAYLSRAAALSRLGLDAAALADNEASLLCARQIGDTLGEAAAVHDRGQYATLGSDRRDESVRATWEVLERVGPEGDDLRCLLALNEAVQARDGADVDRFLARTELAIELGDRVWPMVASLARAQRALHAAASGRVTEALELVEALPDLCGDEDPVLVAERAEAVCEVLVLAGRPAAGVALLEEALAGAPDWLGPQIHERLSTAREAAGDVGGALASARAGLTAALRSAATESNDRARAFEVYLRTRAATEAHARELERADELAAALSGLEVAHERLKVVSSLDPLTGLLNRQAFEARATAQGIDGAQLALLDLDSFKVVNDEFGHAAGDEALRRIALVLTSGLPAEDLVARFGGEEFVVLRLGNDSLARDLDTVRRRLAGLAWDAQYAALPTLSFSCGVVCAEGTLDGSIAAADALMYEAKRAGGDAVWSHVPPACAAS